MACNVFIKEVCSQVRSCEFYEIFINTISIEHLRATVSGSFVVEI